MKTGWQKKMLGDICGFVRGPFGGSLKKSIFVENGFAVYEQQHAIYNQFEDVRYFIDDAKFKEMQRFELHPNDLIMSCSGTMGKVAIVPDNIRLGIINQALLKLTPSSTVSSEFLKYWMISTNFQDSLKEQSGGAAIQNVASVSILKEINIELPPLQEQQRIVGILDEAFDGIATAKANAEKNLKNARVLFESHLQSVFTQRGEGWAEKPLSDVCDLLNGFAFKSGDAVPESETQLVRMGNLYGNSLNLDRSPVFYLDSFAVDYCKYILKEGDLIMSLTGTTGKEDYGYVVRIPECNYDLLMNQRIAKFDSIREDLVNRDYLMHYLRSRVFLDILYPTANGTRQANLSSVIIKTLPIPLCSIREQKMIASSLESLSDEIQHLESIYQRKLVALDELKKSLLHQAFTGQLSTHFIETTIL